MTLADTMRNIKTRGKPGAAAIYRRHGVTEPTVGLSYADLGVLVKKIGVDHTLALGLWDTGLHDARVVATKVADPTRLTKATLTSWLKACTNYVITDAVSGAAARAPGILPIAIAWSTHPREWTSAAGWSVIAILSMRGGIDDALAADLVARVTADIHESPNRARYSMNNALIAMGGSMPAMHDRAIAAARSIGLVHVDHGETDCRTPDAVDMIGKMVAHRAARRTRVTGPRATARPRNAAATKGAKKAR
jgi:3-methyladenine DNA glycosylase AlkD